MENAIVGIGEILWDVFPKEKQLGGAPANFAYHASRSGFNSMAVSAIGDDDPGDEIEVLLARKEVRSLIERVNYPTGTVQVTVDSNGNPGYKIMKDVAWDNIPWSEELQKLASHTSAVCFGSLAQRSKVSKVTINRFLDAVSNENTYKIFDINLRQNFFNKQIIEDSLNKSNILKLNDEELTVVTEMFNCKDGNIEKNCQKLLNDFNLKILILTCGTEGSYVFNKDETSFLETPKVKVADTVGAGDSFAAAFCASILHGKPIREAHRKAIEISAFVCTQNGAMPEYPKELLL